MLTEIFRVKTAGEGGGRSGAALQVAAWQIGNRIEPSLGGKGGKDD